MACLVLLGCVATEVEPEDRTLEGGSSTPTAGDMGTRATPRLPEPQRAAPAMPAAQPGRSCVGACAEGDATAVQTAESTPDEPTIEPGQVVCSARFEWANPSWIWDQTGTANLPSDAEGNVYYVASFANTADFGTGPLTTLGVVDSVLVKLSPACEVLWVKRYAGGSNSHLAFNSVAVDHAGDLIVAGTLYGQVDFGRGVIAASTDSGSTAAATLVLKLDREGQVLWNRSYSSGYGGTQLFDLGVSDAGDIVISGYGGTNVHLDGTEASTELEYSSFYIASLTGEGEPRFLHQVVGDSGGGWIEVLPSGRVAIVGWVFEGSSTAAVSGFEFSQTLWDHYLLMLDASGAPEWSQHLEQVGDGEWSGLLGSALGSTRADALVLETGRSTYVDGEDVFTFDPELVRELDVNGDEIWSRGSRYAGTAHVEWLGALAVDSHDQVIHIDEVHADATLDGESFSVGGPFDFLVKKHDAEGELLWKTQLGSPVRDVPWALATDPSDAVWVGHDEEREDGSAGASVITKLAP